eukprot:TRINITY_DN1428_c0_g1_i1.p1 TRINITY_DN1428_c0_g1~~TRINITY_DN1428_c0_g1_i1.p1  ORF type:complete len:169 (-),score=30.12 TRINITY_DN1428_c0_g1_i1:15-521(-)
MKQGELVGDDIMFNLVSDIVTVKPSWLLDGYPRTINQANRLINLLEEIAKPLHAVLYIKVDQELIIERITNRLIHEPSGRTYHKMYKPPKVAYKDDVTGEDLIQRHDDTLESVKKRLEQFNSYAFPLLDLYKKMGILYEIPSPSSDIGYIKMHEELNLLTEKLRKKTQ